MRIKKNNTSEFNISENTCPNNSVIHHITKMHEINAAIFDKAKQNTFKNSPLFGMGLTVCKELLCVSAV